MKGGAAQRIIPNSGRTSFTRQHGIRKVVWLVTPQCPRFHRVASPRRAGMKDTTRACAASSSMRWMGSSPSKKAVRSNPPTPPPSAMFGYLGFELVGQNISMLLPSPFQEQGEGYLLNQMMAADKEMVPSVAGWSGGERMAHVSRRAGNQRGARRREAAIYRPDPRHQRSPAGRGAARAPTGQRAGRPRPGRARQPRQGRVSGRPVPPSCAPRSRRRAHHFIARGDRNLPTRFRPDIEVIRRNVEMEARLIDDLLDLMRIMNQKMVMAMQDVDLHAILQNAEPHLPQRRRHLHHAGPLRRAASRCGPSGPATAGFLEPAEQPHKFTPIGGTITVRSSNPSPGQLLVEVTDTGRGIEPELLPRIFKAFEQGDSQTARRFGGLGLGLTISKAIIDAFHGTLTAESPGKGKGRADSPSPWRRSRQGQQMWRRHLHLDRIAA